MGPKGSRGIMAGKRTDSPEITVRAAVAADGSSIAALSGQLGYPARVGEVKRRVSEITEDRNCELLVAESGGKVVAWLLIHLYRLVTSDCLAQVAGLVVDEDHRNKGIGALLMEKAEEWARTRDCRGVMLRSRSARKGAHRFYERLGYSDVKTQDVFLKEFKF